MQVSLREITVSGFGGGLSIAAIFALTGWIEIGLDGRSLLIASMGASAVLLFAAPKSPPAQPWNVIAGHVVSAAIGVAAAIDWPTERCAFRSGRGIKKGREHDQRHRAQTGHTEDRALCGRR